MIEVWALVALICTAPLGFDPTPETPEADCRVRYVSMTDIGDAGGVAPVYQTEAACEREMSLVEARPWPPPVNVVNGSLYCWPYRVVR